VPSREEHAGRRLARGVRRSGRLGTGSGLPGQDEDRRPGRRRATIVEQSCGGSTIVGNSTTHGGRGYYFTVRFPDDDATARATFEGILASIRSTDPP
jgi:hypothetical protein